MENLFKQLDGSGRPPRKAQSDVLKWLEENWDVADIFVIRAPVGVGKAYIASAVGLGATGPNFILVPNNSLVTQNEREYPGIINCIKGRQNYACQQVESNRKYKCDVRDPVCDSCPYMIAYKQVLDGKLTCTNAAMFSIMRKGRGIKAPRTIILDEAHLILDLLRVSSDIILPNSINGDPAGSCNVLSVWSWLARNRKHINKLEGTIQLKTLLDGMEMYPEDYVCFKVGDRIHIKSLTIPRGIVKSVRGSNKTVMMSATLSNHEVEELVGHRARVAYIDIPSEFPVENRMIRYDPVAAGRGGAINNDLVARKIYSLYKKHGAPNTLVHCTYGMQYELMAAFRNLFNVPVLYNDQNARSKSNNVELLKRVTGYIWFASGCAEGLDLKDDMCRLQIFPQLVWPNLGDPYVTARRAKQDGQQWYQWQMLRWLMQATGRSTRNACDSSTCVILDPLWPSVYDNSKNSLTGWFREAVDTSNF